MASYECTGVSQTRDHVIMTSSFFPKKFYKVFFFFFFHVDKAAGDLELCSLQGLPELYVDT